MNRGFMRRVLRRRLQDTVGQGIVSEGNWTDSDLNEMLNQGLLQAQKAVMRVNPLAFMGIDRQNLEAGKEFYEKPDGMWALRQLRRLDSTTGKYVDIEREDYYDATRRSPSDTRVTFADFGGHVAITPIPTAQVIAGLEWLFVPSLTVSQDTDVPRLHAGLHMLPVYWSQRMLLGESGELQEARVELNELIQGELGSITDFYQANGGHNDVLTLVGLQPRQ